MKYCIFNGSLAIVNGIQGDTAFIVDDFEQSVPTGQILLVPEKYEAEIKIIMEQLNNIRYRMSKLDEAYHNKSEALRDIYTSARGQEYKMINKLLRELKERTGDNE